MSIFKRDFNKSLLNRYKSTDNTIRIHKNNKPVHELAKCILCIYLLNNDYNFETEARFKTGGRADIFILNNGTCIEIVNTETDESIENKKCVYPGKIIKVNAEDVINTDFENLYKLIN